MKPGQEINDKESGFTLIVAVVVTMVFITAITGIIDIATRKAKLTTSSVESSGALYAADTGLECALYYDLNQNIFFRSAPNDIPDGTTSGFGPGPLATEIKCGNNNDTIIARHYSNVAAECGLDNINYEGCYRYQFLVQQPNSTKKFLTKVNYGYKKPATDGVCPGRVVIISDGFNGQSATSSGVINRRFVYSYEFGGNGSPCAQNG